MKTTVFFKMLAAAALCASASVLDAMHIGYLYPAGGQAGTTVEILVGGRALWGATGVRVSGGGVKVVARGDISIASVEVLDDSLLAPARKDKLQRLLLENANKALKLVKDVAEQRGKEAMKELGVGGMLG